MITVSNEIAEFLKNNDKYVAVFGADNYPHPVVATEGTPFPFATYTIDRVEGKTKDGDDYSVVVYFWFDKNQYNEMATFLEAIIPDIKNEFDFEAATMDFIEDNLSYVGIINFLTYL